jgi:hypothetical protein
LVQPIGVRVVFLDGTAAKDRFSCQPGSLQRPKPKPLPIKQDNGIYILALKQLGRAGGVGAANLLGFTCRTLVNLITNDADGKAATQDSERGLVSLVPAATKTDDAQTQDLFHRLNFFGVVSKTDRKAAPLLDRAAES